MSYNVLPRQKNHAREIDVINDNQLSPTFTPTATPTFTPTATPTFTPTATPTFTPIATPTAASTPNDTKCMKTSWNRKFFITLVLFLLLRFRGVAFKSETFIASKKTDVIDYAKHLFSPIYNMSHVADYKYNKKSQPHQISVNGREDITSFGFDLGGTTCACNLAWNVEQYWQRVWYGPKYIAAHCVTALLGVFFYHRWQWVVVWKYVNEILEELSLTIYSKWAGGEKITEIESRYDTVVNDMLLSGLTFMFLGQLTVYILRIPDSFAGLPEYELVSSQYGQIYGPAYNWAS